MKLRRISYVLVQVPFTGLILSLSQPARAQEWHGTKFLDIHDHPTQSRLKVPVAGRPVTPGDSIARARDRFLVALGDSARKAGTRFSGEIGTVDGVLERMVRDTIARLHRYADSLTGSAGGRLSSADQDTLRGLESRFVVTAKSLRSGHGRSLRDLLGRIASRLEDARMVRARCTECAQPEDFRAQLSAFMEDADGLAETLVDTAVEVRDSFQDALSDSADACRSLLEDTKDRLADLEGQLAQRGSAFIGGVRYTSHFAYRGRDNGLPSYALIPSVTYRHSSGLSVNLARYWLEKAYYRWSETDLGAEYDFDLTDEVSVYIGYTRFWFADSSELSRSIFTNSADAGVSLSIPSAILELYVNEDFGTRSQFTAIVSISFPWTIGTSGSGGRLDFQPGVAAVYGQQLFRSVPGGESTGAGVSTMEPILQEANFFGIIDYELNLPLTLTFGPMTLSLSILYDIPINVVDGSTATPFLSAAGIVSIAVR